MELIIGNKVVTTPIKNILYKVKSQLTDGRLSVIKKEDNDNIAITCPIHKGGHERRPSCYVFANDKHPEVENGWVHCFTCGYSVPMYQFIADLFNQSSDWGKEWLKENCELAFISEVQYLPEIVLSNSKKLVEFMDDSVLDEYRQYHPYMWERKLTKEVVDFFEVGYDAKQDMITFPVRDEYGRLVFITKRHTKFKRFEIPEGVDKPLYLYNKIKPFNFNAIAVVESQINALYMNSIGIPTIGLIGTGSKNQYELLNKCGIRTFNLYFDGDEAGYKGAKRFIKNIRKDVIVNVFKVPDGKDVNDLTKEEILSLPIYDNIN